MDDRQTSNTRFDLLFRGLITTGGQRISYTELMEKIEKRGMDTEEWNSI